MVYSKRGEKPSISAREPSGIQRRGQQQQPRALHSLLIVVNMALGYDVFMSCADAPTAVRPKFTRFHRITRLCTRIYASKRYPDIYAQPIYPKPSRLTSVAPPFCYSNILG